MPDLEKVIEGLNDLRSHFRAMAGISSSRQGRANHIESARTIEDAIALLKEQEPVIPKRFGVSWFCGNCKTKLVFTRSNKAAYCWRCGKTVKWE